MDAWAEISIHDSALLVLWLNYDSETGPHTTVTRDKLGLYLHFLQ